MRRGNSNPPRKPREVRLHWEVLADLSKLTGREILWSGEPETTGPWHSEEQALLLVLSEQAYCLIDTDYQNLLNVHNGLTAPRLDELLTPATLHRIGAITDRQRDALDAELSAKEIADREREIQFHRDALARLGAL